MNRQAIFRQLLDALAAIDIHPKLIEEIIKIIVGSGCEQKFLTLLLARLNYLSLCGLDAVKHEEFELLGSGVFSMHLSGRGFNIRILYSFLPDGSPSLLTCFYERAGKKQTDYTGQIELAKSRYKERLEAHENERSKK